jgi:hypothetical protein
MCRGMPSQVLPHMTLLLRIEARDRRLAAIHEAAIPALHRSSA